MDLLKQRIGRTVLYKTTKLNSDFGVEDLYLKMEGLNPTGHMHDRVAYYLVKEAVQLGFKTIVVASLGQLGESLAFVSEKFGIGCRVVMPEGSVDRKKRWFKRPNVEIIEAGSSYNEAYQRSRRLAADNNWYDANHGYSNCCITDNVYAEIAEEIVAKLGDSPKNIFCFLSNGALVTGLHYGFRSLWRRGLVQRIPRMLVACAGFDNPLYRAWKQNETRLQDRKSLNRYKGMSKNTIEYSIIDPQNVLNAVYDSGGAFISVTNEEIRQMIPRTKSSEDLKVAFRGAAALSACAVALREGLIDGCGANVVVLEEGKNELNIRQLGDDDFENIEQLADYVDTYLGQYGDDRPSVLEALRVAFEGGFVLGAYISGEMKGLAVVIKMPVGIVMPQYHLVYIGADITAGSRGIGTRLMEKVRKLTDGNFSLHVDVENKKAIKLYEKMGLKKAYYRMIAIK
ncbi:MAG: pyridoxal-phosphate dependent enzyme [Candidatus Riflebacteria bacterium]|nr:pyridoxal-phosphate dependent enzyme [Candidatus Riflebacteria bacterium]